jgi:hypothetical protein
MRDLFIAAYVADASALLDVSPDEAAEIARQAARHAPGDMLKCLGNLAELEGALRYAASPRVPVELAMFRCCRAEKESSYDALVARMERLEARLAQGLPAPKPEAQPVDLPTLTEEPPWDAPPEEPPPAHGHPALFEEGWEEPPVTRGPEEKLPGQMDLFAGLGPEAPPPAAAPGEPGAQDAAAAPSPAKVWRAALEDLKAQRGIFAFAAKGRAADFDGRTLTLSFTEDERQAARMLEDEERMGKLSAAVDKAAGSHVEIKLKVTQWSPSEQKFIDRSRAVLPRDTVVEIEKKE